MLLLLLLGAVLAVNGLAPARTHSRAWSGRRDDTDGRLPTSLVPFHYNVELLPDVYHPEPPLPFSGRVEIYFECVEATDVITINNDGLSIIELSISISVSPDSPGSPAVPSITSWEHDQAIQFLHFHLEEDLVVGGRYILSMDYTGILKPSSQGQGLYWDSYEDENDETVYIAATQFESIFTRMAVPSFDEPDFKATFNTTVVHRPHFIALANTPIISTEERPDGWVADRFDQTPIMSCYLLCIVVGDFVDIYAGNDNGYEVRVWSRPQIISQMEFSAYVAPRVHAWLDENTGYRYTLPKMDHIALPSKGGAMENWGLITYGEESFCINPETSPTANVLLIANIISHELAHQWYGNLVTCKWWNEAWLNEGFATYFNYYPTIAIGWDASATHQVDARRGVMQILDIDARNNSDPVRKVIPTNKDGPSAFGGTTYPKGGALLRMISAILSEDTFYAGLRRYLVDMQYKGATTDDLWRSLNAQAADDGVTNPDGSALDIGARMDPWLNQMGFPLVTVTTGEGGTATLTRSQFLNPTNQVMDTPSPWNYLWDVPITVVTSQSPADPDPWSARPIAWIDIDQTETTISDLPTGEADWFVINAQGLMFYRVHYDDQSRTAIVNQLNTNYREIAVQSRAAFIDDTFTLARAGIIDEIYAMDTTEYLSEELEYNPWYPAVKHFTAYERLIRRQSWYLLHRAYVVGLSLPVYSTVGWVYDDSEEPIEQYLRRDVISLSCSNGYFGCVDTALQEYYAARVDPTANVVAPNNLPTVLCIGTQLFIADWDLWFNEYLNRRGSKIREERYAYLFALACSNFQNNIFRYYEELIGPNIQAKDKNTAAGYLALNDYGSILLFNYLDSNWNAPAFSGKFTTLQTIVSGFVDQAGLNLLTRFIETHPPTSQSETNLYAQMVLTVEQNIAWVAQNADSLGDWLRERTTLSAEAMAGKMHAPLSVSPAHHWRHVMETAEDDELF